MRATISRTQSEGWKQRAATKRGFLPPPWDSNLESHFADTASAAKHRTHKLSQHRIRGAAFQWVSDHSVPPPPASLLPSPTVSGPLFCVQLKHAGTIKRKQSRARETSPTTAAESRSPRSSSSSSRTATNPGTLVVPWITCTQILVKGRLRRRKRRPNDVYDVANGLCNVAKGVCNVTNAFCDVANSDSEGYS